MQTTSEILMIRPVNFSYNAETAVNNAFQQTGHTENAQGKALEEFDTFVSTLRKNGVHVTVVNDTPEPFTPDSIFPNNWISFHADGSLLLYPMFAANRRLERKQHVINAVTSQYTVTNQIDLSRYEQQNKFLEGTGSMVLDRDNKIAYACLSPRTNQEVIDEFCVQSGYEAVVFDAFDASGNAIYHTNVLMCIADSYVVICLDSITSPHEEQRVKESILSSGKKLIPISIGQMDHFAGNMLQVHNDKDEKLLIMSTQAYESLTDEQITLLKSLNRIVHASLQTIETNGGGSARCMMAEIHLPKR